jgi:hypothetical protein
MITGAFAQKVAGLTAYGLWSNTIYAEGGVYRTFAPGTSQPLGTGPDATNVIQAVAPYWRVAAQKDFNKHSAELGTFGTYASLFPGGSAALATPTNNFLDWGFDGQYQYIGEHHIFSANATFIRERQWLNASYSASGSANSIDDLNAFNLSGGYIYDRFIGAKVGYFSTFGTTDNVLYVPAPITRANQAAPAATG